jgi:hypothetical protein
MVASTHLRELDHLAELRPPKPADLVSAAKALGI